MSHLLDVNRIVFCMCAHKTDVDHSVWIVDLHYKPVVVALNVEHNTVIANDACAAVLRLDLSWSIPVFLLHLPVPSQERLLGIGVTLPELSERLLGNDPHGKYRLFPFRAPFLPILKTSSSPSLQSWVGVGGKRGGRGGREEVEY